MGSSMAYSECWLHCGPGTATTMGWGGISAPAPKTPPPPPSLSCTAAEVFLSHILTPLFPDCNFLLHRSFSPPSLRHYPRSTTVANGHQQIHLGAGCSTGQEGIFWQCLSKIIPVVPSLLKLCHLSQIEENISMDLESLWSQMAQIVIKYILLKE